MSLANIIRNISLSAALASCTISGRKTLVENVEEVKPIASAAFAPNDFSESPYVQITQYQPIENPISTLIHIRQAHYPPKSLEDITKVTLYDKPSVFRWVNNVQRDIYFFLSNLRKDGVNEVWPEGFYGGEGFNPADRYNSIFRVLAYSNLFNDENGKPKIEEFKFIPGAELLLAMTAGYNMIPGEDYHLNQNAILNVRANHNIKKSFDKMREDYVIKQLVNSGKNYGFVMYGARHDFLDNINDWNAANPDKKLAFIELSPKSLLYEIGSKVLTSVK